MLNFKVWLLNLKPIGSGAHAASEQTYAISATKYDYITVVGEGFHFFSKDYLKETNVFTLLLKYHKWWINEKRKKALMKW